jgi:uncharacterized protein YbaR (Trm112 family)
MTDPELLKILCCPETRQAVAPIDSKLLTELNKRIAAGSVRNRAGRVAKEQITDGLLRADGKILYPIRHGIPVMLLDEGIVLT